MLVEEDSPAEVNAASGPPVVKKTLLGGVGMKDTGATATAGSEGAVQGLVTALIRVDPGAKIEIDSRYSKRPWFRFGSGIWDQALYKVSIESSRARQFVAYAIPTADGVSVPLLVGMSHLKPNGTITDLGNGIVCYAAWRDATPHPMRVNAKGHYCLDIMQFLTGFPYDSTEVISGEISRTSASSRTTLLRIIPFRSQSATP